MPSCHRVVVGVRKLGVRSPEFFPSLFICLALCLPCAAANPSSGTAPFIFDGNRIYAELAFVRPDGTLHKSLAFVDLGSPSTIVSEALFRELQLDQKKPLTFNIGDMPIHVDSSAVTGDTWLPFSIADNRRVEALLPEIPGCDRLCASRADARTTWDPPAGRLSGSLSHQRKDRP